MPSSAYVAIVPVSHPSFLQLTTQFPSANPGSGKVYALELFYEYIISSKYVDHLVNMSINKFRSFIHFAEIGKI